jgi:hypothetical protein
MGFGCEYDAKANGSGGGGNYLMFIGTGLVGAPEMPRFGAGLKRVLGQYTHHMHVGTHPTRLALETNTITLHPDRVDRFGRRALVVTCRDHADDLETVAIARTRRRTSSSATAPASSARDAVSRR